MIAQRIEKYVLIATFLFAQSYSSAATNLPTSYERYAVAIREAIVNSNASALRDLIGNEGAADNENINFALGVNDYLESFRAFFTVNKTTIFVDSVHDEDVDVATIYFVRTSAVPHRGLPGTGFISKLNFSSDFIACEAAISNGKIFMPNNFCFLETDAFQK